MASPSCIVWKPIRPVTFSKHQTLCHSMNYGRVSYIQGIWAGENTIGSWGLYFIQYDRSTTSQLDPATEGAETEDVRGDRMTWDNSRQPGTKASEPRGNRDILFPLRSTQSRQHQHITFVRILQGLDSKRMGSYLNWFSSQRRDDNSTKQSPYWEPKSRSAMQGIPKLLWNYKVYYCVHKNPRQSLSLADQSSPHPQTLRP